MTDRHQEAHERWLEQAAAYALGALDGNEVPDFERHLEGCEACRSEIRWLKPAVDALPESVTRMEPPPELRDRVLREARRDRRSTPVDDADDRLTFGAWIGRLGSGALGWKPLGALAAAALVVVAFAGYEIGSGGSSDKGGGGQITQVVTIPGREHPQGVKSKVIVNGNRATVRLANVKQLPDDRVLEAWVLRNEKVEPVKALFVPDRHGNAATDIPNMRGVETVLVTREPKGGTESPTSSPIAAVKIPQS